MEISAICRDNGRVVSLTDRAMDFISQPIVTCNERMRGSLSVLESVAATDLRILIAGDITVTAEAAAMFAASEIKLLGIFF